MQMEITREMDQLKVELKAKFGKDINLDTDPAAAK
jgi:hypothetical protein